jgi:hypothetical protein
MAADVNVYDVMVDIIHQPSVLQDVGMKDSDGEPVLPKLPVFVVSEDGTHWLCCWYNVQTWSPVFDIDPVIREHYLAQSIMWTGVSLHVG